MSIKLYVGGLPYSVTETSLKDFFTKAGAVVSTSIINDRETGRSRGFGFVVVATKEAMNTAIETLNGKEVAGRTLTVNEARPKEARTGGFGGGRGNGGGFRGGNGGGRSYGGGHGGGRNDDNNQGTW